MASAWGSSWGSAWGSSWGSITSNVDYHDGDPDAHKRHTEAERKRTEEFKRGKEKLRSDLEAAWTAITQSPEPSVVREAIAIAKPAIPRGKRKPIQGKPMAMPNFDLLSQFRLRQLMQLHQDLMDEEEILLFMDDD